MRIGWGLFIELSLQQNNSTLGSISKEELEKLFQESKDTIEWQGEQFVPKPMKLSRINLGNVRDKQFFQNKNVKVSYTTSMLSMRVNIDQYIAEKFVNEIFGLNTKIQGIKW